MSQSDKNADLSGAIKQLEALLDAQSDDAGHDSEQLPVLDEIVDPEDPDSNALDNAFDLSAASGVETARPDPQQIRALLERVAEQMDTELENVAGMLKQNMLKEFRNELASALNMDPQQLGSNTGNREKYKS